MIPLTPADSIKGREVSTAWPIICSNGSPSAGNKSPGLFCTVSSNDWPTFVPRRQSQLKLPSVKPARRSPLSSGGKCTLTFTPQFIVTGAFPPLCVYPFCLAFFSLSKSPCRAPKSNFVLAVQSRSAHTLSYCLLSGVIYEFTIQTEYYGRICGAFQARPVSSFINAAQNSCGGILRIETSSTLGSSSCCGLASAMLLV